MLPVCQQKQMGTIHQAPTGSCGRSREQSDCYGPNQHGLQIAFYQTADTGEPRKTQCAELVPTPRRAMAESAPALLSIPLEVRQMIWELTKSPAYKI